MTLMVEIAKLAKDNDLHIQTHISECIAEVNVTEGAFKTKYANIYDINGILTNKVNLQASNPKFSLTRSKKLFFYKFSN